MTHPLPWRFLLLATVLFCGHGQAAAQRSAEPGVVVEEVTAESAAENAGIQAGDVLLAWARLANPPANPERAEGSFESVFHWMWVEMEQGPRGIVKVRGERYGKELSFDLVAGNWGIKVRPRFGEEALKAYLEGQAAIASKQLEKGIALWSQVTKSAEATNDLGIACWVSMKTGDTWAEALRWKEAQIAYDSARELAETTANVFAHGFVWDSIGLILERQNRFAEAEQSFQSAFLIREKTSNQSLSVARSLNSLGVVAWSRGDLAKAEDYYKRAVAIRETLAPGSLDLATSLNNLGNVAHRRGDLTAADAHYTRALAIRERVAPGSLGVSASLNGLALVARDRGDLAMADTINKRVLVIRERLAPDGLDVAVTLNNLGLVAWLRGDLATAESYQKRALRIREKLAPDSIVVAASLNNLGVTARGRGDLAMAESYLTRALLIQEKLAPSTLDLASSLTNLGIVAWHRGDAASAERYYERAFAITHKLAPDSLVDAFSLNNLGVLAQKRGDLQSAETYHTRALAIRQKLVPASGDMARSLNGLGVVAGDRGDLTTAEAYHKRALAIRAQLSPGSADEAESHHDLAVVYRAANQMPLAADHFVRAIDALEAQVGKLAGGQEAQAVFGAQFTDYYRDYMDLLIAQNQPGDAFHILERSRARTLLAMLAERDLVFTADVPEDTERERKRIAWEYDQAQARLARLNPLKEQAQIDASLHQIRELRDRRADIVTRIRQQSPKLAALQYPQALEVNAVLASLDPGTVVLSYSVGKNRSHLFALTPSVGVQVYALAGETQLREEVERFRNLIQRARLEATDLSRLVEAGRDLYEVLVQPAAKMLDKATRVLVVADGPLHALPFAALVREVDANAAETRRGWQYFVEWKPVHVIVSATVYAELRKARQNPRVPAPPKTLVAFGDPRYPASARTDETELDRQDAVVRSALTQGYRLTPLPATKTEVAAIASLYRESAATYLGEAATEERAKEVAKDARYLHFASHGLLDERFPLNSGLALSIPAEMREGQDNGILQAWEIFERLRIDADLVVLSACETGLGKEMGGEGLVGLTRAFHYAGARSVLASLWSVADDTTATLMTRFYGYLKAGRSKDAALRQAQLDLIRGSVVIRDHTAQTLDASHPFYWAAFQLSGDWR